MGATRTLFRCIAAAVCAAPLAAAATNGYFQHGYGLKSKGRAGVSSAIVDDTFGGATNPAKMVFVGNRIDFGADLFSPRRESSRVGSAPALGPIDGTVDSDSIYFIVPEFGYNRMMSPNLSLGVTVYANGGMNTDYPGGQIPVASACPGFATPLSNPGPYNLLCGTGQLGVDLMQLVIAPTLAWKIAPNHSIGISPLIGYQRFAIEGLQGFGGFSTSPTNLTNNGHDDALGYGLRVGWYGQLTSALSVGAAYSTKIYMEEFDKYKGLFAEQGDFDMPVNYNIGFAYQVNPKLMIAADYQRVNYSDVKAVGNPSANLLACAGGALASCLGGANGAGFGWQDVNVWKIAFEYKQNERLTLRAGYHHTDNPIRSQDVTFNILAPGVVQDHVSFGMTYKTAGGGELTLAYMHAFSQSVTGPSFFNNFTGGAPAGTETIKMHQNSFGIAYGWRM